MSYLWKKCQVCQRPISSGELCQRASCHQSFKALKTLSRDHLMKTAETAAVEEIIEPPTETKPMAEEKKSRREYRTLSHKELLAVSIWLMLPEQRTKLEGRTYKEIAKAASENFNIPVSPKTAITIVQGLGWRESDYATARARGGDKNSPRTPVKNAIKELQRRQNLLEEAFVEHQLASTGNPGPAAKKLLADYTSRNSG